jgi:hypothetical protein
MSYAYSLDAGYVEPSLKSGWLQLWWERSGWRTSEWAETKSNNRSYVLL